ncbi:MAG: Unknown protein [uncultured Sulfurovum sp.]|uniref:Uncharacterized protein n=1 Tax=uncultured Sulfurovum sp. TaxID=269237 RepID=A0A6S6ST21_9BACT|nr:MAG: Unknown protein [uncultured Sulfurovum sp.]
MKLKLLLTFILLNTTSLLYANSLTLEEKRNIAKIEKSTITDFQEKLNKMIDTQLELSIDWESISDVKKIKLLDKGIQQVYIKPLLSTFKNLSSDALGKEALKELIRLERVKKIVFSNKIKTTNKKGISLKNGVLTIDQRAYTNWSTKDVETRAKVIYNVLGL